VDQEMVDMNKAGDETEGFFSIAENNSEDEEGDKRNNKKTNNQNNDIQKV
jgi:hypothetical protein